MKQFIEGSDAQFAGLAERAKVNCVRFRNEALPPGSIPATADIGFEVSPDSGAATLLVDRRIRYTGSPAVKEWLESGVREFPTFVALRDWVRGPLAEAFRAGVATGRRPAARDNGNPEPSRLTDMSAVREGIQNIHRPLYLDEKAVYDRLRTRVLGQDGALETLAGAVSRHCARRQPRRPAVAFALGPSGIGKTRTAEVLAEELRGMDSENAGYQFLRLDMSEYQESHRVSQLIGAPQGYVGYGEGSQLLDALRANPRQVVLFDEIEKAHPAILRVLMNAMDAGRLSTASGSRSGHQIDCRFAIFIFTSNLDSKDVLDELEARGGFGKPAVEDEVCRRRLHTAGIAPEIVGRIGCFLVYRPLSPETRAEIVTLAVREVAQEFGLEVSYVEPGVVVDLMEKVRSQNFGVRPERSLIDNTLGSAFAQAAKDRVPNPVDVRGPPYRCETHGIAEEGGRNQVQKPKASK